MNRSLVPVLLALFCFIAGAGWFLGPAPSTLSQLTWLIGFLVVAFTIGYRSLFLNQPFRPFPYIVLGIVLLNFLVQLTGGVHSYLWPSYFVFASIIAVFSPLKHTLAASCIILVIEGANLYRGQQWELGRLPVYAGFTASLLVVPALISHIIHRTRVEAEEVKTQHNRLIAHAHALDPLADADTIQLLTKENQLASNIKAARDLQGSFAGLLNLIYEFVPANAYALFVKERVGDDDVYVLRARRSDSNEMFLAQPGEVLGPEKDKGMITGCIRRQQPLYIAKIDHAVGTLGYYTRSVPIRSILAIPLIQDGDVFGILVVDSLEAGAFSLETQDMVVRFAPFFIELIEKIQVSQELSMRARTFAGMHTMSKVLNSTLLLNEMLEGLARELTILVPYDFCVFVQYDDPSRTIRIAHHSGSVELANPDDSILKRFTGSFTGHKEEPAEGDRRIPLEDGTLVKQMIGQWGNKQSSPYHFFDLKDRAVLGLFDSKTRLTRQLRSLSCWPLTTGEKFIGAFFLGSLRPNAFSEFHRTFLDMLSIQIALVMDNAILHQQISNMARTDGLTGLLNHRTFMEKLMEEYRRIDREQRPFSVLLMDIDKFKSVNDTYGHPVGDIAIKAVARVLKDTVRTTDFVARYGGEEFAVGMVDTSTGGAEQMAERVRSIMEKTVVTTVGSKNLMITLSIGVASFPEDTGKITELVGLADAALYQAKRSGRNRVCLTKHVKNTS